MILVRSACSDEFYETFESLFRNKSSERGVMFYIFFDVIRKQYKKERIGTALLNYTPCSTRGSSSHLYSHRVTFLRASPFFVGD